MKVSSKDASDMAAKLTSAMQRNTSLATNAKNIQSMATSPVSSYTVQQPTPAKATRSVSPRTSGMRFKPQDHARIREVIQAGLGLQETLSTTEVVRLALQAFDPKRLTPSDIARVRASDGRSKGRVAHSHNDSVAQ